MEVKENPALAKEKPVAPLQIEFLSGERKMKAGERSLLKLRLKDGRTKLARSDVKDLRVLYVSVSGKWRKRGWAKSVGDGVYESEVLLPKPGMYHVFFECPSLNMRTDQFPQLLLQATGGDP
jgi:hypothetical protein